MIEREVSALQVLTNSNNELTKTKNLTLITSIKNPVEVDVKVCVCMHECALVHDPMQIIIRYIKFL